MKLKTRKSVLKRVNVKKNFIVHKCACKGHLLRKKSSKQLRKLSKIIRINSFDLKNIYNMIPYYY